MKDTKHWLTIEDKNTGDIRHMLFPSDDAETAAAAYDAELAEDGVEAIDASKTAEHVWTADTGPRRIKLEFDVAVQIFPADNDEPSELAEYIPTNVDFLLLSPTCPNCGAYAAGIVERLNCIAEISVFRNGGATYDGYSEMLYDTQEPELTGNDTEDASKESCRLMCGACHCEWDSGIVFPDSNLEEDGDAG